jgi:uncharacterized membrane protein
MTVAWEPATPPAARAAERVAAITSLDAPARKLADLSACWQGALADLARGKPLGHPLHPALTDLPIGFWTSSFLLDLLVLRRFAAASRALVGAGVLSAVPTIVAGVADVATLEPRKRRVAVVHAGANAMATSMYAASWSLRRRHHAAGVTIGLAAAAVATVGGYLGGWLAFGAANPRERSTARSQVP